VGTTEAIRIRKGLSIYKQPIRQGRGSPYWYARVYMLIGDRDTHTRSTRTADTKADRFGCHAEGCERLKTGASSGRRSVHRIKVFTRRTRLYPTGARRLRYCPCHQR
jgi:hypothetical protein